MLDSLRAYFSRIDERPVEQIDHDIDEELATHLALLEEELIQSGLSPATARETALLRFGNPQKHKRRCRDVALEERRMKTYLQITVTIACVVMLGVVTASVWFNLHTLAEMSKRMEELTRSISARVPARPENSLNPTAPASSVYIMGSPVSRPGHYQMPADGLTLRRLLAVSGTDPRFVKELVVRFKDENTAGLPFETITGTQLTDPTGYDTRLNDGDLITVVEGKP